MIGMVVLRLTSLAENRFLLFRNVVSVGIGKHPNIGSSAYKDTITQDHDSHRRIDITPLIENLRGIHNTILVCILENQDAISLGSLSIVSAIIDDFADPNASTIIDIEIG